MPRRRSAISHIIPTLIAASVALAIIPSIITATPTFSSQSMITLQLDNEILLGKHSEKVVMYRVYVTANSPLPYAGKNYERPPQLYYEVRPPRTLSVRLGEFERVWRPFAKTISESVKKSGVTYLPAVRIDVIAVTENGSEYSAQITLTTKAAVILKRGGENAKIRLEDIVNDMVSDPLTLFHGLNLVYRTSNLPFTQTTKITKIGSNVSSGETKALTTTSSVCEPYAPYDPAIGCYLSGDQGIVPGSVFSQDSPWRRLYDSRNNPPSWWRDRVIVAPDSGLDENEVEESTWHQLATYFSSAYYVRVASFGSLGDAIAALDNFAQQYISAPYAHTMGNTGLDSGFLAVLYGKAHGGNMHDYPIYWADSKFGYTDSVREPIAAVYAFKADDVPVLPSTEVTFIWSNVSELVTVTITSGAVTITLDSITVGNVGRIDAYAGDPTKTEDYGVITWKVSRHFGHDLVVVDYMYTTYGMTDNDPSNDYLILYPTFVILPDIARVPDLGSIRAHSSDVQAWNSYVAPYRRIVKIKELASKTFSSRTDDISVTFMFVERRDNEGTSYYSLLGLPSAIVEGTLDTIIGSYDPTGLYSFVMGWVKQLGIERYSAVFKENVFVVSVKSAVDYRDGLNGTTVVIESEKPLDPKDGSNTVKLGFVFRVYVYGSSQTPCDPISGNCAMGVTHS